jgi:Probable zinc-ribbon domain
MQPRIIKVSDYSDIQLTCLDCGCTFTWTAPEQAFFQSKGFNTIPKRCKPCRDYRRLSLVLDDRPAHEQAVHQDGGRHDS